MGKFLFSHHRVHVWLCALYILAIPVPVLTIKNEPKRTAQSWDPIIMIILFRQLNIRGYLAPIAVQSAAFASSSLLIQFRLTRSSTMLSHPYPAYSHPGVVHLHDDDPVNTNDYRGGTAGSPRSGVNNMLMPTDVQLQPNDVTMDLSETKRR